MALADYRAGPLQRQISEVSRSAKEMKLLALLRENPRGKTIVFANFRATLARLESLLTENSLDHAVLTRAQSAQEKDLDIARFKADLPVLLCSDSGGEGHNMQFANTLINFDLPWNPMRIEQRIGRVHRIGQTREVFVFNLCTAGSIEQRILGVLNDKIRMFEMVVGEVGSILGNLENGDEFESLVLNLWLKSRDNAELDGAFVRLGDSLLGAHEEYLKAKELDDALFGEDYQ